MPLVVPGVQSTGGDAGQEWMSKLAGKKLGEEHNETTFATTDLPKEHRVLKPDSMKTMDFKPDRMNVHVDEEGVVKNVTHG